MTSFCRFDLRTTDPDAARAFYAQLLGHACASIWPLHEQALARGARPHWLGQLGVEDVEESVAAFVARGAVRLGPTYTREGGQAAVLRDPGGAVLALGTPAAKGVETGVKVTWHVLNTQDLTRSCHDYQELFHWHLTDRVELTETGPFQQFAFERGGPNTGAIVDIAGRPSVHPHWLFFFEVAALEPALELTRAAGGHALEPMVLPNGERFCVCDDPQGAAFALRERQRD